MSASTTPHLAAATGRESAVRQVVHGVTVGSVEGKETEEGTASAAHEHATTAHRRSTSRIYCIKMSAISFSSFMSSGPVSGEKKLDEMKHVLLGYIRCDYFIKHPLSH